MKNFTCFILVFLSLGRSSFAQNFHLLLMADDRDPKLGIITLKEQQRLYDLFSEVANRIGYKFIPFYLTGDKFNGATLQKTIAGLAVSKQDIICFYYLGLPQKNPSSQAMLLKVGGGKPISVSEVEKWVRDKKARLNLILADSREEIATKYDTVYTDVFSTMAFMPDLSSVHIKRMFLDQCGVVRAVSSAPDQPSYLLRTVTRRMLSSNRRVNSVDTVLNGSLFTHAFIGAFNQQIKMSSNESIRGASLNKVLESTKRSMDWWLRYKSDKKVLSSMQHSVELCEVSTAGLSNDLIFPRNSQELEAALNHLIKLPTSKQRQDYANRLQDIFDATAMVKVMTPNAFPPTHPSHKVTTKEYLGQGYLQMLVNAKPNTIKPIKVSNSLFQLDVVVNVTLTEL